MKQIFLFKIDEEQLLFPVGDTPFLFYITWLYSDAISTLVPDCVCMCVHVLPDEKYCLSYLTYK